MCIYYNAVGLDGGGCIYIYREREREIDMQTYESNQVVVMSGITQPFQCFPA